jgi:hypothetical protein
MSIKINIYRRSLKIKPKISKKRKNNIAKVTHTVDLNRLNEIWCVCVNDLQERERNHAMKWKCSFVRKKNESSWIFISYIKKIPFWVIK